MNDVAKKWDKTGLLEGLTDTQKDECAAKLNLTAQWLIEEKSDIPDTDKEGHRNHEDYCGCILPIVRRAYDVIYPKPFPDVRKVMDDFSEYYNIQKPLLEDLRNLHRGVDVEAEMCELYITRFKEKFMR